MQGREPSNLAGERSRLDGAERRGDGVRELHQRFQHATTSAEFEAFAAEAERRRGRHGLPPPVEAAYEVLLSLARQRARALAGGASAERDASS